MPLAKDIALNVLGLPIFATPNDILLRYKALSLTWFPENHCNYELALHEFRNITRAVLALLFPHKEFPASLSLQDMYGFFQYIFFGNPKDKEDDAEYDSDEFSAPSVSDFNGDIVEEELKAAYNAQELIAEEERGKVKAEKRKAKKKKRKEKKKQEKLEKETPTEKDTPKSKARIEDPKSPESEEDIDTSSAFVSVIAKKHKVPGLQSKNENTASNFTINGIPKEDPQSVVLRSRQLALRGNEMASLEHFSEAIELFSEAIKLAHTDYRFYGNRSYCYDMLRLYDKALKDAEKSLVLCSTWPKGHFRKGRALLGLKKYALAEQSFAEVLKYDEDCEDALSELHKTKILQIMEKGFSKEKAEAAIKEHGVVSKALSSLLGNGISFVQKKADTDIFISDDESDSIWASVKSAKLTPQDYDIKRDPTNPEGHKSLWIGNVQADVTEKKLLSMFSKFGDILSIRVMPEKYCAFVNYKNKSSPGKAMQTYQGFELSGRNLYIRFPTRAGEEPPKTKTSTTFEPPKVKAPPGLAGGSECYFWRTSGCVYGDQCRYQHIKEHKGIDRKK